MAEKIKRRIKSKSGFTMTELLMALLILLMVTAIVAAGIPVAANAYDKVVTGANAQVLLSTAMTCLRDELGTAKEINNQAGTTTAAIEYISSNGSKSVLSVDSEKGIMLKEYADIYTPGASDPADKYTHTLVSDSAANKNLVVKYGTAVYDEVNSVVKFTNIAVYKKIGGDPIVKIDNYSVKVFTNNIK